MRSARALSEASSSFGLFYSLMRLHRPTTQRSRRVPARVIEGRVVAKFTAISLILASYTAFLPLSYTYNLHSLAFSCDVMQENGCWYQNETTFYSSTHLDFKCKCALRRKTRPKGWKERTPRRVDSAAPRFATSHPIYPSGCSKPEEYSALSQNLILRSRRIAFAYAMRLDKGNFH